MSYCIPQSPAKSVFRPYDIRGPVSSDGLTEDLCYAIGIAVGSESQSHGDLSIVTGRDGRLSSAKLYKAFLSGLQVSGMKIIDIGLCTSPMLYFARVHLKLHTAAILTASHSPKHYNGLKIIINDDTLLDEKIQNIYHRIIRKNFNYGSHLPIKTSDIKDSYIAAIVSRYKLKNPTKIVIDCGNGAGSVIAEALFKALGCEIIPLYCDVDGNFPNHHPDPINPENLKDIQKAVIEHQASCGFAFDGDADRIGIVDANGQIILTDRTLMLLAEDVLTRYEKGTPIVFDIKCSDHLANHIKACGGVPEIWTTGHSRIKKRMHDLKAPMAGEMSAHIFFHDNWIGCDDGMYTGARILSLVENSGKSYTELMNEFQIGICTPEIRIPMLDNHKHKVIEALINKAKGSEITDISTLDGLRVSFPNGWGLIRASLTEPSLTMRFEGKTTPDLQYIQTTMENWLNSCIEEMKLS